MTEHEATASFLDKLIAEMHLREADPDVLAERLAAYLSKDERFERGKPAWEFSRRELFFGQIFRYYSETYSAISRLDLAASFLKKIQPRDAKGDVVAYHVEKHQETYIGKERLVGFLRYLQKRLRKRGLSREIARVEHLEKYVAKGFEGIAQTRGQHVHQWRLDDEDIRRVGTLDFLVTTGELEAFRRLKRILAREVLTKWRRTVEGNARSVRGTADQIFRMVDEIVFRTLPPAI